MPEKISDEKRREIIGRMFLVRNAAKVAEEVGVAESTVRNVMKEVEAGVYPEYTGYLPSIDAIVSESYRIGKLPNVAVKRRNASTMQSTNQDRKLWI